MTMLKVVVNTETKKLDSHRESTLELDAWKEIFCLSEFFFYFFFFLQRVWGLGVVVVDVAVKRYVLSLIAVEFVSLVRYMNRVTVENHTFHQVVL